MPRPDLTAIDGELSYVTLTRPLVFLGARTCLIELTEHPLQRCWLPRACIVSQAPVVGGEATLRVPIDLAVREGLVRAVSVRIGSERVRVTAPRRAGDRITLSPNDGGEAA